MGYTTKFIGHIALSRTLTMAEAKQLLEFNEDPSLIPNDSKPSSYMQWVPSETMNAIVWDGGEKFYDYDLWMQWLLFWLSSKGIQASGELRWRGESSDDIGLIHVLDGVMTVTQGDKQPPSIHKPLTLDLLAHKALDAATAT